MSVTVIACEFTSTMVREMIADWHPYVAELGALILAAVDRT
ncbi:hypothetical protein HNR05_002889 [Leifsonia psychrotolerans]|uniref:Uncharacterized protein n=1 Tax=Glaciibacter psychrotolerans TaxID=670054 RepID=A0A7Z0J7L6_9MICO|nr:hypothetical protein [Leifsonia psychrotolerans]NYJ21098.1 hypothetical protein [Leifsonia psychrotolerans]